jgi:hypothetical protein
MANLSHIARFGLPGIDPAPFGMNACYFYSNRNQLVTALAPYLIRGLRGSERCLRVTGTSLRRGSDAWQWVTTPQFIDTLRASWDLIECED